MHDKCITAKKIILRVSCSSLNIYPNPGLATEVDLVVEKTLVLTAYLAGQPGRISADFKNHYSPQSAAAIVMHAGKDFSVYGPAAGGRRAMRGAQSDIEKYDNIGVILAPKFPDTKTYLSPSTANHFLKRLVCFPHDPAMVQWCQISPSLYFRDFLHFDMPFFGCQVYCTANTRAPLGIQFNAFRTIANNQGATSWDTCVAYILSPGSFLAAQ